MSADLVTWLRGCLDEDQRSAEACINEVGAHRAGEMYSDGSGTADYDAFPSYPWGSDAAELAYMAGPGHPARVLAEVAAKRAILDAMSNWQHEDPDEGGYYACPAVRTEPLGDLGPESFGEENCDCGVRARRRQIALLLAAPFASRPGFDPSWLD